MATVAALKVVLTAKTASFARGMGRAGKIVGTFGRTIGGAITKTRLLSGSLVGLAAGGGLAYLGSRSARTIDALGKTADKLGATTEGLASLRHMAQLSGLEANTFDMALQRLVRRTGTVAAGSEAMGKTANLAAKYFRALNLDAKALSKLPADEIFLEWARALGKIQDQSTRVALAFKFVDSEGVAVVNMIDALTRDYPKFLALTESLGIRMTRVQVKQVEMMNDAFLNLRTKIGAIAGQTLIRLAPVFEAVFKRLTEAIGHPAKIADWLVGKIAWIGRGILRIVDMVVPVVLKTVHLMTRVFRELLQFIDQNVTYFRESIAFGDLIMSVYKLEEGLGRAVAKIEGKTIGARIGLFVKQAIADARTAAAVAIGARPPLGRLELEGEPATALAGRTYGMRLARPSEFGGFAGGPPTRGFWGGSIELKVQKSQLEELKQIRTTLQGIARAEGEGLGA